MASAYDTSGEDGAGPSAPSSPAARIAVMRRAHGEKLKVCGALEEIADALPDNVDRLMCVSVASTLLPMLRNIHRYEEEVIFPAYVAATADMQCVERLKAEHVEDECFADELTEALMTIGHGAAVANPEALGFMLRGFFETIRRHVAFERDHILAAIAGAQEPSAESASARQ
jgi:hypothetical protein